MPNPEQRDLGESLSALAAITQDVRALMHAAARASNDVRAAEERCHDETRRLLLLSVEVLDAFDRVFHSVTSKPEALTPQVNIWLGNFRSVRRLLERHLHAEGVVRIETVAAEFEPHWHVVGESVRDQTKADGVIVDELTAGYLWRGELLRKSEIVVVRNE